MAIIERDAKGKAIRSTGNNTNINGTAGRPTSVTPEVLIKLEQAFAIDATVEEALAYAEISTTPYYSYLEKHPEFSKRIAELRQRPVLKARQTIVGALSDPEIAMKYLERKKRLEFAPRVGVEHSVDETLAEFISRANNPNTNGQRQITEGTVIPGIDGSGSTEAGRDEEIIIEASGTVDRGTEQDDRADQSD